MVENKAAIATVQEKNITDNVLNRVSQMTKEGSLQLPPNYSASNALKSAYLILQEITDKDRKPVLVSCSKASIQNSLLDMVVQGLSPAKKQCYFVPYGGKLTLMRSYMGTIAATKRLKGIKDVKAFIVYEGDVFEQAYDLKTATISIVKFEPKPENMDNTKIKYAFAVILGDDGPVHTEVMNMSQIKSAWGMSRQYNKDSKVHNNFTDQMAKKTVINRACKNYWNTSDDSDLLIESFNRTEDKELDDRDIVGETAEEVHNEIQERGAQKEIDIIPEESEPNFVDVEVVEDVAAAAEEAPAADSPESW